MPSSFPKREREREVRRKEGEAEGERERLSKDSPVFPHLLSLHPPRNDRSTRNFKLQRTRYPAVQLSQVINSLDVLSLSLSLSSTSTKSNPPSRVHAPTNPSPPPSRPSDVFAEKLEKRTIVVSCLFFFLPRGRKKEAVSRERDPRSDHRIPPNSNRIRKVLPIPFEQF